MVSTVEQFRTLRERSGLLNGPVLGAVRGRWLRAAGPAADDLEGFTRWLIATRCLTAYQARRLRRGHTDGFFLDRYKILRRLGEGPLARVYKAVGPAGQPVALKVLPPSRAAEPRLRACFARQSRAAGRLLHPHVVRTLRAGAVHCPWPGNIREMQNVLERAVILSPGPELRLNPDDLRAAAPPPVTVSYPVERQATDYADFTARIAAVDSVEVRAHVWGYLDKVHFKEGALVKKGEVLFELDPRPYQALLDQAKGKVRPRS